MMNTMKKKGYEKIGVNSDVDEMDSLLANTIPIQYQKLEQTRKAREKMRLVCREKEHKFNIRRIGVPQFAQWGNWYHTLLEYSWWKLLIGLAIYWLSIHLIFGILYYLGARNGGLLGIEADNSQAFIFFKCFAFSVQTLSTIGYGTPLAPYSFYVHLVVVIEAFVGLVLTAILTGVTFAKIARPTRIARQIIFSEIATINTCTQYYAGGADNLDVGNYSIGECPVISIRVANVRKSQLCDTAIRLLLLRRETESGDTRGDPKLLGWRLHELDYELSNQMGRVRGIDYARPYLPVPWVIKHAINEKSPLYGLTRENMMKQSFELIVVLDGIDEAVSMNVQARWSYIPSELMWNVKFVDMMRFNQKTSTFDIDYSKISDFAPVTENEDIEAAKESASLI